MMARPIGGIIPGIMAEIAENSGISDADLFAMFPICANQKGGPETLQQQRPALTCNATKER